MTNCPACGKENPPGRPRCADCGAKIPVAAKGDEDRAGDKGGAPFQALGAVELKKARLAQKAVAPATPDAGPSGGLSLPDILPLGKEPDDEDSPPIHSILGPKNGPKKADAGTPLASDVLEKLIEYAADGALEAPEPGDPKATAPEEARRPVAGGQAPDPPGPAAARSRPPSPPAPRPVESPEALELDDLPQPEVIRHEAPRPEPAQRSTASPATVQPAVAARRPEAVAPSPVRQPSAPLPPARVLGRPPIPPPAELPEIIRSMPSKRPGLASRLSYGLRAPVVARHQREVLGLVNAQLARHRRLEQEHVAALGRAARRHDLLPEDSDDLRVAAEREEARGRGAEDGAQVATKAMIEIDTEIGRAVLRGASFPEPLRPLTSAIDVWRARIQQWEKVQKDQQSELELFDGGRARSGYWILVGGTMGFLALLLIGGEVVRQVILALEG